jgi:Rps23 Pro-64 3,4-dihydroxylase Tpa1-like proline 4-hydroxylase
MKIEVFETPFPYIRIFDLYEENELKLIWEELEFILNDRIISGPEVTGSATDDENNFLKKNKGIFLDELYSDRNTSNILTLNRKVFINLAHISNQSNFWLFKKSLISANWDTTLISYYENSDHYKKHSDISEFTCLTWFFKKPKKFSGGDLIFPDFNFKIEVEDNSFILFPSGIEHEVSEVKMNPENMGKKMGRVCMSQFMGHGMVVK